MKILILGIPGSDFIRDLLDELYNYEENISVYFYNPFGQQEAVCKYTPGILKDNPKLASVFKGSRRSFLVQIFKNYSILKKSVRKQKFDVVHVFFLHIIYVFFISFIKKNTNRFIVTIFGSDFYRNKSWIKKLKGKVLKKADLITATNPQTIEDVFKYYKHLDKSKKRVIRFGNNNLSVIDELSDNNGLASVRKTFDLPLDKKVVVVGYSGSMVHQQIEILKQIDKIEPELKKEIILVFPLTYGNQKEHIITEVKNFLADRAFVYRIFNNFLTIQDLAALRLCTDIFISLPLSDQLSRTLKENIYAGSIVITGSWLPYEILEQQGAEYYKINGLEQLPRLLNNIIKNQRKYQINKYQNKQIIEKDSLWSEKIKEWAALYEF